MSPGDTYGSIVADAHRSGDLHIHGIDSAGGYWASWDCVKVLQNVQEDAEKRLEKLCIFLEGVKCEWHGFQRLTRFDSVFDDVGNPKNENIEHFINEVEKNASIEENPTPIFLSLVSHKVNGENNYPFSELLFKELRNKSDVEKRHPIITPIVTVSNINTWSLVENLSLFRAASTLYSPILINTLRSNVNAVLNPWIDGCVHQATTGVIGAITLNLPRAAYKSKSEDSFLDRVGELVDISVDGLEKRRTYLERELKKGRMPFTATQITTLDDYYEALHIVGVHEALIILLGKGIDSMQGKAFAYRLIETIREKLDDSKKRTGHNFCLEALPSNGASYRLAEIDKEKTPDIITSGVEAPFYNNSTCLPVDHTDDLWDALEHQKKLQTLYNGGTIFNIYLGRGISDPIEYGTLAKRIIERDMVPCFAFSPTITDSNGDRKRYERLGFTYRSVSELKAGEREEVLLRKPYDVVSGW